MAPWPGGMVVSHSKLLQFIHDEFWPGMKYQLEDQNGIKDMN